MAINTPNRSANRLGSGFVNLQRVLQANKSNKLGSSVAGGIQQAGQAAQGAIQQAGQAFQNQAQSEKDRLESEKNRVSRVLGGNVAQATEDDVNAFEGIRGGKTKAKTSIENADELAEKGREAQSLGQATGNEGGRFGLLQRYIGGNERYTGGQQRLDNVLLGQTGQADLRKARVATSGLEDQARGTAFAAEQQGMELQNRARGLADETIGRLGESTAGYDAAMRQKAIEAAAARENRVKGILDSDLEVEEDVYNQLSQIIDPKRDVLNTELNDYIKANLEKANRFGVQDQSDFDKIKMLQRLTGNSATGETSKLLDEYNLANAGEVGAFDKSGLFTVPSEVDLNAGIKAKEGEYGDKAASNKYQVQHAVRSLTNARPDEYAVTGGYYGQLLNDYNRNLHNQTIKNQPYARLYDNVNYGVSNDGSNESYNSGSQYVEQHFGSLKDQIEQAKNSGVVSQSLLNTIAAYENQLKAAEAKQKEDEKFHRVGRILRKKPAAV